MGSVKGSHDFYKMNSKKIGNRNSISFHLKKVASSTIRIDKKFISDIKLEED